MQQARRHRSSGHASNHTITPRRISIDWLQEGGGLTGSSTARMPLSALRLPPVRGWLPADRPAGTGEAASTIRVPTTGDACGDRRWTRWRTGRTWWSRHRCVCFVEEGGARQDVPGAGDIGKVQTSHKDIIHRKKPSPPRASISSVTIEPGMLSTARPGLRRSPPAAPVRNDQNPSRDDDKAKLRYPDTVAAR